MKFSEAMKALEEGKRIRLLHWDKLSYVYLNEGGRFMSQNNYPFGIDNINWVFELYEEPVKTYTFQEIIPFLKKGENVKRSTWKHSIIRHLDGGLFYGKEEWGKCSLHLEDIEACDWIVVK